LGHFAENGDWGSLIIAAKAQFPSGSAIVYYAINGHFRQCSPGDPQPDDFSGTKLGWRGGRCIACRTGTGIVCTIDSVNFLYRMDSPNSIFRQEPPKSFQF